MLRIYSGAMSGIGLWSVFAANLLVLGLAVWGQSGLLVILSIMISVGVLIGQIRLGRIGNERILSNSRLFVNLREDNFSGDLHWVEPDKILGFTFSEMFLKAGRRKKGLRVGSRQCSLPYWTSVCNMEIPPERKPVSGFLRDLGMASWTSGFSCSVNAWHLSAARHGNNWLRLPVSADEVTEGLADRNGIKKNLIQPSVKVVELCLKQPVAENDAHRDYGNRLLELLKELRQLSGGKPTGVRLEMSDESYARELCRKIWECNITPDFVIVEYSPEKANTPGALYRYLTLIDRELEGFCLRDQIRILVSCQGCHINQLIRMRHCGADAFMIVTPALTTSGICFDDYSRSWYSTLVYRHRQWIQEIFGSGHEEAAMAMPDGYADAEGSGTAKKPPAASIDTSYKNILKKFIYHFN